MPMFQFTFNNGLVCNLSGIDEQTALATFPMRLDPLDAVEVIVLSDDFSMEDALKEEPHTEEYRCERCHRSPLLVNDFMGTTELILVPSTSIDDSPHDIDIVYLCPECITMYREEDAIANAYLKIDKAEMIVEELTQERKRVIRKAKSDIAKWKALIERTHEVRAKKLNKVGDDLVKAKEHLKQLQ